MNEYIQFKKTYRNILTIESVKDIYIFKRELSEVFEVLGIYYEIIE